LATYLTSTFFQAFVTVAGGPPAPPPPLATPSPSDPPKTQAASLVAEIEAGQHDDHLPELRMDEETGRARVSVLRAIDARNTALSGG